MLSKCQDVLLHLHECEQSKDCLNRESTNFLRFLEQRDKIPVPVICQLDTGIDHSQSPHGGLGADKPSTYLDSGKTATFHVGDLSSNPLHERKKKKSVG